MALIKSALELALEKTEGLTVDKAELRRKELFNQGRVAAAKALEDGLSAWQATEKQQSQLLSAPELRTFHQGAADNLLSRITLSVEPAVLREMEAVAQILDTLTGGTASALLGQAADMVKQYGQEIQQLKDAINQQLGPQLRQRAQQQGINPAKYVLEKDPAYVKVLAENLEPLRAEYLQTLEQVKTTIRSQLAL